MTQIPVDETDGAAAAPQSVDVTPANIGSIAGIPPLARIVFGALARIRHGSMTVTLPDGRRLVFRGAEPGENAELVIRDFRLTRRFFSGGDLGAAEAFLDGMWDSPNVTAFLQFFLRNKEALQDKMNGIPVARLFSRIGHLMRRNSKTGSRRNIEYHYDLGNRFYTQWLDPTMTYSAARFTHPGQTLSEAQINKYRSLAEQIDLRPEHHLLEIGSGWGGFAEYAAQEIGCRVTGITISKEQLAFARERMAQKQLSHKVDIRYQDYRDVDEKFDRIASIEMFEAVGEEYWPTYFRKVRDCLKPGGKAGLQIITIADRSFAAYRKRADFIQRYIFPGGMLPSPSVLRQQVAQAGLTWADNLEFGLDYAETLRQWRERFRAAWPDIRAQGFDERFRRMWEYYFSYCEAGFRAGNIDVTQVTLARQ